MCLTIYSYGLIDDNSIQIKNLSLTLLMYPATLT